MKFSINGSPIDIESLVRNHIVFIHRNRKPPKVCAKGSMGRDFFYQVRERASTTVTKLEIELDFRTGHGASATKLRRALFGRGWCIGYDT